MNECWLVTDVGVSESTRMVADVGMSEATQLVTDIGMSEAAPLPLQYPVKCEPDGMDTSDDLKPHQHDYHHHHHQQQQHRGVLDEVPSVIVAASSVPSSFAVVTSPSLFSVDDAVLYQRQDGLTAASRNVTPVKCMCSLVTHVLYNELVLVRH